MSKTDKLIRALKRSAESADKYALYRKRSKLERARDRSMMRVEIEMQLAKQKAEEEARHTAAAELDRKKRADEKSKTDRKRREKRSEQDRQCEMARRHGTIMVASGYGMIEI